MPNISYLGYLRSNDSWRIKLQKGDQRLRSG